MTAAGTLAVVAAAPVSPTGAAATTAIPPAVFRELESLPVLVESRDRLSAALTAERPLHGGMVAAVETDIGLAVAVLRLANRERLGRRGGVGTIPAAIEVVTRQGLARLCRQIPVVDFFEDVPGWAVTPDEIRGHAVTTQRVAAQLMAAGEQTARDELAVAALLHDVGKLAMGLAHADYLESLGADGGTPEERLLAEREAFGIDHASAGGELIRRWGLPDRLAAIVEAHHHPAAIGAAAVLRLADMYAHYEHEETVDPGELARAAARSGVDDELLRSLMQAGPWGSRRPPALEPCPLSKSELMAMRGLADGKVYKQIAVDLNLSPSTIRTQLKTSCQKLGVRDRAQAVLLASKHGWL